MGIVALMMCAYVLLCNVQADVVERGAGHKLEY